MNDKVKNDSVVQTRCKRTTLATLVLYLESKDGYIPRSISELVRDTLEGMEEMVIAAGASRVEDTSAATRILTERGFGILNTSSRGKKNLWNNLIIEDRRIERTPDSGVGEIDDMVKRAMKSYKAPTNNTTKEEMKEALNMNKKEEK